MIRLRRLDGAFFEQLSQRIDVAVRRLNDYVADPSEKNIHGVRTSIRRVQAAYSLTPKPMRKRRLAVFVKGYSSFFRSNSRIRDYDIVLEKLERYGVQDRQLVGYLGRKRGRQLDSALKEAKSLLRLKTPRALSGSAPYAEINERFRSRCLSLTSEIRSELPKIAQGESGAGELHELRITVKKLRYLLELQASGDLDSVISSTRSLQRVLGRIHDSDMFVDYAVKKSARFPSLESLIPREREARRRIFERLSGSLS